LLEKQKYPVQRAGPNAEPERPYDVTGWTLPYQMGVEVVEAPKKFDAALERVAAIPVPPGKFEETRNPAGYLIAARTNNTAIAINRLLKAGREVAWTPDGSTFTR